MIDTTQNSYLWMLPNQNEKDILLKPNQHMIYNFPECFDGRFSYEVWIYSKNKADTKMAMHINGETIYEAMKIMKQNDYQWQLFGNFQVVKGEHTISLKNMDVSDIQISGILITRDARYVHSNIATEHLHKLNKGQHFSDLLKESKIEIKNEESSLDKETRLKRLYREGFIDRFDQDLSEGRGRNGVPMGGIGAGKLELDCDGVLTSITTNNNFEVPIFKTEGSFFAVRCKDEGKTVAKVLQKTNFNQYPFPTIDDIEFNGLFPTAQLNYIDCEIPVSVSLDAYSFLIPNDIKNSTLPAVTFKFNITNNTNRNIDTSLLFSFENIIGTGGSMAFASQSGRQNNSFVMNTWNPGFTWSDRSGNYQTIEHSMLQFKSKDCNQNPSSFGEYTMLCDGDNLTYNKNYDVVHDAKTMWDHFVSTGELVTGSDLISNEDTSYLAGGISTKFLLKPNQTKEITFVLSWYMPHFIDSNNNDIGVYYTNHFNCANDIANYVLENNTHLLAQTKSLHNLFSKSSLPQWLTDKLVNDMFPIYTCSWFSKDGKFAINEAPTGMMGCLGTIDQRLASNVIYTNLFSELDEIELDLFAQCQGENGSISHDLGFGCFDISNRGGTWSDLCSSFVMQVYKHYIYTGNTQFAKKMYPLIKKAVAYQISIDFDKNNIPDVGAGNGTTYDTYHWYGTSSFVSSLWLAELKVCIELAQLNNDLEFELQCTDIFSKAQTSMIDELWNSNYEFGSYFNNYNDKINNKSSENCFIAQLAGQWFANLMDLGDILPKEYILKSIETITNRNVTIKGIKGFNDETTPDGDFGWYGYSFLQYNEVYYGCLAIYNGFIKEGVNCFNKIDAMTKDAPWNIALTYFANGRVGGLPYYMTNTASSFILEAISGYVPNVAQGSIKLSPNTDEHTLSMPLFSPKLWLWLDYSKTSSLIVYKFSATKIINNPVDFREFITEIKNKTVTKVLINNNVCDYIQDGERITMQYNFTMLQDVSYEISISVK